MMFLNAIWAQLCMTVTMFWVAAGWSAPEPYVAGFAGAIWFCSMILTIINWYKYGG